MSLENMPNELLLMVGSCLPDKDLAQLVRVHHHFYNLYIDFLYSRHVKDAGNVSVHWAIQEGFRKYNNPSAAFKALRMLLAAGADPNATDHNNSMPLLSAVRAGSVELVRLLVKAGAFISRGTVRHAHPVYQTIADGNEEIMAYFLSAEGSTCFSRKDLDVPMLEAALNNHQFGKQHMHHNYAPSVPTVVPDHEGIIRLLLDNKEDVDARNQSGCTALHIACQAGHFGIRQSTHNIIKALLDAGADPTIESNVGDTPLLLAMDAADPTAVIILIDHCPELLTNEDAKGRTPIFYLYRASTSNHPNHPIVRHRHHYRLHGVHYPDPRSFPTSPGAALEILKLFLSAGASLGHIDKAGNSPLHTNIQSHDQDLFECMLHRLPHLATKKNRKGVTALHSAADEGLPELITLLLDKGADVNAKNYYKSTPLHRLCMTPSRKFHGDSDRWLRSAKIFFDRYAKVNDQDKIGQTPLMKACYHENHEMKMMLESGGVDTDLVDFKGRKAEILRKSYWGR